MSKYLVIVESPAKAKTIKKYLGPDYKVIASMGHIRDLPESHLGVDENDFKLCMLLKFEKVHYWKFRVPPKQIKFSWQLTLTVRASYFRHPGSYIKYRSRQGLQNNLQQNHQEYRLQCCYN